MVSAPDDTPVPANPTPAIPFDLVGAPAANRLVLLHGFTQNRHCWGPVPGLLAGRPARHREVVVADAPGHGAAAHLAWSLADAAGPYADGLAEGRAAQWLGYSMGGRLALHIALARPEAVGALVLVGASPGITDAAARAERRAADEALAAHLEAIGTAAFVEEWLTQPLFAGLDATSSHRGARLANDPAGLASSLRLAGTGAQDPLWDALGSITAPVLLVVGEDDPKFTGLAEAMQPRFGGACDLVVLPGTGHACHLEAPEAFCDVVDPWLDTAAIKEGDEPQAGTP